MKLFYGVVKKEAGSAFGVEFPDVPGCFSAAESVDEVLSKACEALVCHLAGEEVPVASSVEAISKDYSADLKAGAFLIAVPYIELTSVQTRVNISLDTGALKAIDAAADMLALTRSAFMVEASRRMIEGRADLENN